MFGGFIDKTSTVEPSGFSSKGGQGLVKGHLPL